MGQEQLFVMYHIAFILLIFEEKYILTPCSSSVPHQTSHMAQSMIFKQLPVIIYILSKTIFILKQHRITHNNIFKI